MDYPNAGLKAQIEKEIRDYLTKEVNLSQDVSFSQAKLVRRIALFESKTYPNGKFDAAGDYKFWFDIISPRVEAEIKNIDFDTKNILVYSDGKSDQLPDAISNLKLKEYLRTTGQAEEINSTIEEGAGWGNFVEKKVKGGYERIDLRNFYVINQTARTLDESPAIERHELSQSDLREKIGLYKNVEEVIKGCKQNSYAPTAETQSEETTTPYYEIYERNGEVCVADLMIEAGKEPTETDKNEYVLAKVVCAAVKSSGNGTNSVEIKYILYAEKLTKKMSDIYKEYHRGRYKGRWFREGLYELLFDIQVRSNQIGNQLSKGLEWASKTIFYSPDKLLVQNILTDLKNGDIIKAAQLAHVPVRMDGFDQLVADWNRLIQMANDIANSREVVQGITPPSGTPLGTTALLNQNANKLFDFIREKLAIPFSEMFEEWIVPDLISDLKTKEILRLTGDSDMLGRLQEWVVNDWYLNNLFNIGPHTKEIADNLKAEKLEELKAKPELLMNGLENAFEGYKPRVSIIITGENSKIPELLNSYSIFIPLEVDPIRRQALIENAMRLQGIDVGSLPKSAPEALTPPPSLSPTRPTTPRTANAV